MFNVYYLCKIGNFSHAHIKVKFKVLIFGQNQFLVFTVLGIFDQNTCLGIRIWSCLQVWFGHLFSVILTSLVYATNNIFWIISNCILSCSDAKLYCLTMRIWKSDSDNHKTTVTLLDSISRQKKFPNFLMIVFLILKGHSLPLHTPINPALRLLVKTCMDVKFF